MRKVNPKWRYNKYYLGQEKEPLLNWFLIMFSIFVGLGLILSFNFWNTKIGNLKSEIKSNSNIECSSDLINQDSYCLKNQIEKMYKKNISEVKLKDSANFIRNWMSKFYNYTRRPDTDKELSDIVNNGGDCYDYSRLYDKTLSALGYKTKMVSIFPENGTGHAFLIAWDNNLEEYCKLDMTEVDCLEFK